MAKLCYSQFKIPDFYMKYLFGAVVILLLTSCGNQRRFTYFKDISDTITNYNIADTGYKSLTIKSDDVVGRAKAYEAIVKGENMPTPGIPESFNVLLHELRGLALDVTLD